MRGIILALTLTLVGSQHVNYEPGCPSDKVHVYAYEGISLSGLPEKSFTRAGLKLTGKIEISGAGPNLCLLLVRELEVEEYNGVENKDPFTRLPKLTEFLQEQLTKPITFQYQNGQVGEIYTTSGVSETAANLIRGIVNMFQLTLKRKQYVYSLQELGIGGVCHTTYAVQENKKASQIIATKSRNENNCAEKVHMVRGDAFLHRSSSYEQRNKNIQTGATYNYKIKATHSGARILEVNVHEVHQFTPFNEMDGAALTEARQKLELVDVRKNPPVVPELEYQNRGSLRYHFGSELPETPIQLVRTRNIQAQITETLQHLVEEAKMSSIKDTPPKFLKLILLLRMATYENLQAIWMQYSSRQDCRSWILDAIPAIANPMAIKFIREKIEMKELTELEAAQALLMGLHLIKADRTALAEAMAILTKTHLKPNSLVWKVTWLAYGSLVQRHCANTVVCPEAALQLLHDLADGAVNRANEEEMVLALKALGNAGQPASIKIIRKFLQGFSSSASQLPIGIQVQAVLSLKNIAKKDHRQVQDIALQLFMNHEAPPEVRMGASMVLLDSKPSVTVLITVANALLKETNLQVAAFMYPQLKALSRSTVPDVQAEAAASRIALKILSPRFDRLGFRHSHVYSFDAFKDSFMAGLTSKLFVMNSAATPLPAAVMANIRAHFMGMSSDLLEVGLQTERLQELIMKRHLSSPMSDTHRKNKIMDILKMLSGWKALPTGKTFASVNAKLFGQEIIYAGFDKEAIQYAAQALYRSEEKPSLVKKLINQLQEGVDTHWSKSLLSAEIRYFVPTCVGLPLETSMYYASVTSAAIYAKAQISPAPSPDFILSHLLTANLKLQSKVTASIAKNIVTFMGINTRLIQAGVEVQGKICLKFPVNIAATMNIRNQNFRADIAPIQQEDEVFSIRTNAFAVTRNTEDLASARMIPIVPAEIIPNILKQPFNAGKTSASEYSGTMGRLSSEIISKEVIDSAERPSHRPARVASSTCFKVITFGYEMCLERKAANAQYIRQSPLYWWFGENFLKVIFRPNHGGTSVEKIQLEFQYGPEATTKMIRLVMTENLEDYQKEIELPVNKVALIKLKRILNGEDKSEETLDNYTDSSNSSKDGLLTGMSSDEFTEKYTQTDENLNLRRQKQSSKESSRKGQQNHVKKHQHEERQKAPSGHQNKNAESKKKTAHSLRGDSSSSSSSSSRSARTGGKSSSQSSSSSSSQRINKHPKSKIHHNSSQSSSSSSSNRQKKQKHPKHPSKNAGNSRSSSSRYSTEESGMFVPEIYQLRFKSTSTHLPGGRGSNSKSSSSSYSSSSSRSSRGSHSASKHESGLLADAISPGFTLIARSIMSDGKEDGFQATAYLASKASKARMQLVVVPLAEKNPWKACTEATITRDNRAMAMFRWGQECQDYKIEARASTGQIAENPAAQLKMNWEKSPSWMRAAARRAMAFVPGIGFLWGFSEKYQDNPSHQLIIRAAATSSQTISAVVKAPKVTIYKQAISVPFSLPVGQYSWHAARKQATWNNLQEIAMMITNKGQAECVVNEGRLMTFDSQKMKCPIVSTNCYSVIAQDCTDDLRFLVTMKKVEQASATFALNVKVGSSEIKIYPSTSDSLHVLFNGMLILLQNTTYENQKEHINISRNESTITLEAPAFGLAKITFDGETAKVAVVSWMKGKTCGICGNDDGQKTNDLQKPNQEKALSCSSFVHSWVLPGSTCSTGECNLNHQFVKLEKQISDGEESICYSIDPVLQCLKGCTPTETTSFKAGFHCFPADSAVSLADWHRNRNQKSEDIIEEVEAHTNCACSTECTGV